MTEIRSVSKMAGENVRDFYSEKKKLPVEINSETKAKNYINRYQRIMEKQKKIPKRKQTITFFKHFPLQKQ